MDLRLTLTRSRLALALGLVLVAAVLAGWFWLRQKQARPPAQPHQSATELSAGGEVKLDGVLRAQNAQPVGAKVDGELSEIVVQAGDHVFAGQLIGKIRNEALLRAEQQAFEEVQTENANLSGSEGELVRTRLFSAQLETNGVRVQIALERTRKNYERQALLYKEGATPRLEYEAAERDHKSAQAESAALAEQTRAIKDRLAERNAALDATKKALAEKQVALEQAIQNSSLMLVNAPADGVVTALKKKLGDAITPANQDLFEVAPDITALEVAVRPETRYLARLTAGDPALVDVAGVPGNGIPARIRSIENGEVVVEFAAPSPAARVGLEVQVRLKVR